MQDFTFTRYELPNGMKVAYKHIDGVGYIDSLLRVWSGMGEENPGQEGLMHFLEHMVGYGGNTQKSSKEVLAQLGIFGDFNAYTYFDKTEFMVGVTSEKFRAAIEYLSRSFFEPTFDSERFDVEKKAILRDINSTRKTRFSDFEKLYLGKNIGQAQKVYHTNYYKSIEACSIDDLMALHREKYVPNNCDLIFIGQLPDDIEKIIGDNFSLYEPKPLSRFSVPDLNPEGIVTEEKAPKKKSEFNLNPNIRIELGIPMPRFCDKDYYSAYVLNEILGQGTSCRLMQALRHEDGGVYLIHSFFDSTNPYSSLILIQAEAMHSEKEKVLDKIFHVFGSLKDSYVDETEIEKVKERNAYHIRKSYSNPDAMLKYMAVNLEHDITMLDAIRGVDAVTPESICQVARKYLPQSRTEGNYVQLITNPILNMEEEKPKGNIAMDIHDIIY